MSNDAREAAWQAWLDANPNKPICTHWREAFLDGYDAAQAALAAVTEAASFLIARAGMDAVVDGELSDYCYFCNGDAVWSRETKSYNVYHEAGCVLMGLRAALDPANINAQVAKGGERETE